MCLSWGESQSRRGCPHPGVLNQSPGTTQKCQGSPAKLTGWPPSLRPPWCGASPNLGTWHMCVECSLTGEQTHSNRVPHVWPEPGDFMCLPPRGVGGVIDSVTERETEVQRHVTSPGPLGSDTERPLRSAMTLSPT